VRETPSVAFFQQLPPASPLPVAVSPLRAAGADRARHGPGREPAGRPSEDWESGYGGVGRKNFGLVQKMCGSLVLLIGPDAQGEQAGRGVL
jgi:hypothetical protein